MSSIMFPILPPELEQHIFSFIDERSLQQAKRVSQSTKTSIQQFFTDRITQLIKEDDCIIRKKIPEWRRIEPTTRLYIMLPSRAKRDLQERRASHFDWVTGRSTPEELMDHWKRHVPQDTDKKREAFQACLAAIPKRDFMIDDPIKAIAFTFRADELSAAEKTKKFDQLGTVACEGASVLRDRLGIFYATMNSKHFEKHINDLLRGIKHALFSNTKFANPRMDLRDVFLKVGLELNIASKATIFSIELNLDDHPIKDSFPREHYLKHFNGLYTQSLIIQQMQETLNESCKDPVVKDLYMSYFKDEDKDIFEAFAESGFSSKVIELLLEKYATDPITRGLMHPAQTAS